MHSGWKVCCRHSSTCFERGLIIYDFSLVNAHVDTEDVDIVDVGVGCNKFGPVSVGVKLAVYVLVVRLSEVLNFALCRKITFARRSS